LCMGSMQLHEYRSQFSLWSIMGSPLILGNDFNTPGTAECVQAVMVNREVIAVNQDPLVAPAQKVFDTMVTVDSSFTFVTNGSLIRRGGLAPPITVWWQVLTRPLASGEVSVVVVCREAPVTVSALLQASLGCHNTTCGSYLEDGGVDVTLGTYNKHTLRLLRGDDVVPYVFNMSLPLLGIPSSKTVVVRDLWAHSTAQYQGAIPTSMNVHGCAHLNVIVL